MGSMISTLDRTDVTYISILIIRYGSVQEDL